MGFRKRLKTVLFCCCCCKKRQDNVSKKRDFSVYIKQNASKDEDPSVVMGNSNATIHPLSTTKKGGEQQQQLQQQQKVSELYSQREITGAVVIERNNNNNKKSKNKTLSTHSTTSAAALADKQKLVELTKQFENRQREHEQELDNLNNQLKERTNRIEQLQQTLITTNASLKEEKNDSNKLSTDLRNEISLQNQEINQQEEKLKIAQYLVDKSNLAVEGLSIVLQNFINQVENQNTLLSKSNDRERSEKENNSKLCEDNDLLRHQVVLLEQKIDTATCRCETLQKELDGLRLNHETELSRLLEQHVIEKNNAVQEKQKEYDIKLKEAWDKQTKQSEEHANEIKKLQDENTKLKEENKEKELRVNTETPRLQSPGGTPLYADRYDNMPEELKSLNIVLEMKTEELKNLRAKNMELERKLEAHQELEKKNEALVQKNQAMTEMLKMKSHKESQLSFERESLLEKYESETKKVSRLSMEKEQLIWRASNPDLRYNTTHEEEDENDETPSPLHPTSFVSSSTPRREAQIAKKLKRRSMNF